MSKPLHEMPLGLSLLQRQRRGRRAETSAELRRAILIIVEDRPVGRHLAELLAAKGYERVRVVRRAASALLLAHQSPSYIAFLDIALSDDAYALASALRRQADPTSLRLIALGTELEHATRERARDGDFEQWLVTPVANHALESLMHTAAAG
jgi:PleD family two-component response regulator